MKVGDKLYCIEDHCRFDIIFYSGCEYEVTYVDHKYGSFYISFGKGDYDYLVTNIDDFYFTTKFMSLSDYRKKKLNKINESR